MQNLFLVSRGIIHPSLRARKHLFSLLSSSGTIAISARNAARATFSSLDPAETPAAILFYNRRVPAVGSDSKQEPGYDELLDSYLLAGGGLLIIGSSDLPQGNGCERFPRARVLIHQVNEFSRVFEGVGDFEFKDTVFTRTVAEGTEIQFTVSGPWPGDADSHHNEIPVVWTRYRGRGRLCYIGLELRAASLRHAGVRAIVLQAVEWLLLARRDSSSV